MNNMDKLTTEDLKAYRDNLKAQSEDEKESKEKRIEALIKFRVLGREIRLREKFEGKGT